MSRAQATHKVLVDDAQVRVTRWDFDPGAETGWHTHGMDYVITTLTPCHMLLEEPGGGTRRADMEAGIAYRKKEGVEHNVINAGEETMAFMEIELKH
jgi:quercetin dioxygenase-like cupin family protein